MDIPTEVKMKLELARQVEFSIGRLRAYEKVFSATSIDYSQVHIPREIQKRFRDWVESQIIIEQTNISGFK